jgi:hypothetical protein
MAEALRWLADGHVVEVLSEAIPWPLEPAAEDAAAAYKRERSFYARSGALPVRITITLVAPLGKACPQLQADQRCGIYARRPMACRIYPAEANPFATIDPALRRCPEAAWQSSGPPLWQGIRCVDATTHNAIEQRQRAAKSDALQHAALCDSLGLRIAALANEGYAVHTPVRQQMIDVLRELLAVQTKPGASTDTPQNWLCLSERSESLDLMRNAGAHCAAASGKLLGAGQGSVTYLSCFAG